MSAVREYSRPSCDYWKELVWSLMQSRRLLLLLDPDLAGAGTGTVEDL